MSPETPSKVIPVRFQNFSGLPTTPNGSVYHCRLVPVPPLYVGLVLSLTGKPDYHFPSSASPEQEELHLICFGRWKVSDVTHTTSKQKFCLQLHWPLVFPFAKRIGVFHIRFASLGKVLKWKDTWSKSEQSQVDWSKLQLLEYNMSEWEINTSCVITEWVIVQQTLYYKLS